MVTGSTNYKIDIMKIMKIKFYKEKSKSHVAILCAFLMMVAHSCVKNDDTVYGVNDEPHGAIGFAQKEAVIIEGDQPLKFQVNASKFLFEDVTFNLVVVSGDTSGITISDVHGNQNTSFTIEEGAKTISLNLNVEDDDVYTGIRKVIFGLEVLKGEGVFIPEQNTGSAEKKINNQFELTINDDEDVPPSISFQLASNEVVENATEAHKVLIGFTAPATKSGSFNIDFSGTAIAGTDYATVSENGVLTINFDAGTELIPIEITPIDNTIVDGNRTVVLTINTVSEGFFAGDLQEHTLTIVDEDLPVKVTSIIAEADAWTRGRNGSGKSNENGGDKVELVASDGNANDDLREFYLKFDLSNIDPSKVLNAKVVLTTIRENNWANAETNFGGITTQSLYYVSDDSWEEMTISANAKPASDDTPIATYTSDYLLGDTLLTSIEHEFDVTTQIKVETDGKLSVRLNTVNTLGQRIFYASREHASGAVPKLVIIESLD